MVEIGHLSETHINSKMGGTWKQCSYNFTQRGRFPSAGLGILV